MLEVKTDGDTIRIGDRFSVSFQRTLRIPDDGKTYPLPPGLGTFPIYHVADYKDRVPSSWVERGGVFIPMYQREALWLNFDADWWKPNAVKVSVGKINAVSGKAWNQWLKKRENDYMVCPPQPWLDGINAGNRYIKQFIAMPLGMGYTVEGQLKGEERFGGIQIIAFEPKKGKFPDAPPEVLRRLSLNLKEMGIALGGRIKQKIYPDPYGINTWDENNYGRVYIHIVNSMYFRRITGLEPPPTPISARLYAENGLPWFELVYDEHKSDIKTPKKLENLKSVKEIDKEKGLGPQQDDDEIEVPQDEIIKLRKKIEDGRW